MASTNVESMRRIAAAEYCSIVHIHRGDKIAAAFAEEIAYTSSISNTECK